MSENDATDSQSRFAIVLRYV